MDDADHDATNGGERFVPGVGGRDLALEHWHRYALASQLARHRRVADIACGDGYGTALLAQFGEIVIGIDRNPAIVSRARSRYRSPNLMFLCGDAYDLPIAASTIGLVVNLETIEHLEQPNRLLSEIKRILVPDGLLFASTPNATMYARTRREPNPHHLSEMHPSEFIALLSGHFGCVGLLSQTIVFGSSIRRFSVDGPDSPDLDRSSVGTEWLGSRWLLSLDDLSVEQASTSPEPTYLIALASDRPIPELDCSIMEYNALPNPAASLVGGLRERDRRILELEHAVAEANARRSITRSDAQQAVRILFEVFLHRQPTEDERVHFTSTLSVSGSLAQLVDAFRQCEEFRNLQRSAPGLFVPAGHFYSPIVCPDQIKHVIPKTRPQMEVRFPDVKLNIDAMTQFWEIKLAPIAAQNRFPSKPDGGFRYRFDNPAFSYADAIVLEGMLLQFRPARIIEVGSGWSTACILDVLAASNNLTTTLTCIDPYPALLTDLLWPEDKARVQIIPRGVQSVGTSIFSRMESNDILFIDSTHVVKTGSDVLFELTEILPILQQGVIIHFHDIFYPFEYGYQWAVEENRSWNEIYALRHFLAFNNDFEVLFFNDMFAQLKPQILQRDCPKFLQNSGGSIWLQRKRKNIVTKG